MSSSNHVQYLFSVRIIGTHFVFSISAVSVGAMSSVTELLFFVLPITIGFNYRHPPPDCKPDIRTAAHPAFLLFPFHTLRYVGYRSSMHCYGNFLCSSILRDGLSCLACSTHPSSHPPTRSVFIVSSNCGALNADCRRIFIAHSSQRRYRPPQLLQTALRLG